MESRLITPALPLDLVEVHGSDFQALEYLEEVVRPGEPRIDVSMTLSRSALEFDVHTLPPRRFRVNLRQLQDRSIETIREELRSEQPEDELQEARWPSGWWILPFGALSALIWALALGGLF